MLTIIYIYLVNKLGIDADAGITVFAIDIVITSLVISRLN
jgi:hypothetical protein